MAPLNALLKEHAVVEPSPADRSPTVEVSPTRIKAMLSVAGLALLLVSAVAAVVTKLYHKSSANMAFVRTGMGGARVIQDGGTLIIPVVHQVDGDMVFDGALADQAAVFGVLMTIRDLGQSLMEVSVQPASGWVDP